MNDYSPLLRPRRLFASIQWRLTATYVAITVFAIMGVEVAVAFNWLPSSPLLLVGTAALAGGTFGFITARVIKLRLRALARASAAIAAGDLSQRLTIDGDDEIADLAEQFNDMAARLDANAGELRRLAASAERSRLASELHDSINQQIFSISMLAAAINKKLGNHPLALDVMRLATLATETHTEMRALIRELRPAALAHHDLSAALKHYVADFGERYNVIMQIDTQPVGQLSAEVEAALYRIAQEALGNAVRHAFAKHVALKLQRQNETIELSIEDDGRGFDLSAHSDGLGLHTMRRRAESIGAEYDLSTTPGNGSCVQVRLSLK